MGMLSMQALIPMPSWSQWGAKVLCAGAVAAVLAVVLPASLTFVSPSRMGAFGNWPRYIGYWPGEGWLSAVFIFALGLYVSSLTTGALRAFLVLLLTLAGTTVAFGIVVLGALRSLLQWYVFEVGGIERFA